MLVVKLMWHKFIDCCLFTTINFRSILLYHIKWSSLHDISINSTGACFKKVAPLGLSCLRKNILCRVVVHTKLCELSSGQWNSDFPDSNIFEQTFLFLKTWFDTDEHTISFLIGRFYSESKKSHYSQEMCRGSTI